MKIPIVCEIAVCPNSWRVVNVVSEIDEDNIDLFFEGYDDSEPEDHCTVCGALGVAEDPRPDSYSAMVGEVYV
jgi:hypothetical protein